MATNNSDVIALNVGGVIYTTLRKTLTKYSDSHLAQMFRASIVAIEVDGVDVFNPCGAQDTPTVPPQDSHGNHVIDRDGELFRYVLNFLRTGQLNLPDGFVHTDALIAEADFYNIAEFKRALLTKTCLQVEERIYDQSGKRYQGTYSDWTILGDPAPLLWLAEVGVFSQDSETGPTISEGGRKLHRSWYNDVRIAVSQEGYQYGFCQPEKPILKECIFNEITALGYKLKRKINGVASTLTINDHVKAFVHLNVEKSHTYIFQVYAGAVTGHRLSARCRSAQNGI